MPPSNIPQYTKDEKVLCFHHELLYEAKVLDLKHMIEGDKKSPYQYRVHYKGWKSTWDDWVPQDRIRKNNEDNKILAANLKTEMEKVQKPKTAAASARKKAAGSDLSSARGSEERHATPATGRGQKRGRDYETEKVRGKSLVAAKSRLENNSTSGSGRDVLAKGPDNTVETRPRKRPKRNLPASTIPTTALDLASKFLIDVSNKHPPSREHLARSVHDHGNLVGQNSEMPFEPTTIPYDQLDQAEKDAGFPSPGYIYPGIPYQTNCNDESQGAIVVHRGFSLPPKTSASCLETARSHRRAKSLTPSNQELRDRAQAEFPKTDFPSSASSVPVAPIPSAVQVPPVVARPPTATPQLRFAAPAKVKKSRHRCPAGLNAKLWPEAPPNMELLSPPVPPPRRILRGTRPQQEIEPQEEVEPQDEVELQDEVEPQNEVEPRDEVEPHEEIQLQEEIQPHEEVEPPQETQIQEETEPQQETQPKEEIEQKTTTRRRSSRKKR